MLFGSGVSQTSLDRKCFPESNHPYLSSSKTHNKFIKRKLIIQVLRYPNLNIGKNKYINKQNLKECVAGAIPLCNLGWQLTCFIPLLSFYRSSPQRCSVKKSVLKNFIKFTGKHLCQGLFLIKFLLTKRLWHRCFLVNFVKFSRTLFYIIPLDNCFCFYIPWKYRTPLVSSYFQGV